ncbi:MAG: hypothetical protein U0531_21650 [Dehalococcoidia bacterium]
MAQFSLNFSGVIVDRQSFLDGARSFVIEAEDQPALGWRLTLSFRWPVEEGGAVDEGDITLVDPSGAELYAAVRDGQADEITNEDGDVGAARFDLRAEVTGGEGGLARASGHIGVEGTIAGQGSGAGGSYEGEGVILTATIDVDGADALWSLPPTEDIPTTP